jgi:hypothetical protein
MVSPLAPQRSRLTPRTLWSASWVEEFVDRGGYANMLRRLHELLAIEWRWVFVRLRDKQ